MWSMHTRECGTYLRFSLKKAGHPAMPQHGSPLWTWCSVKPGNHRKTERQILYDCTYIEPRAVIFIETESRMVFCCKKLYMWGFPLLAQWLRIHLPRQGSRVRALVREDPTCRGATKPVHHNYWACALEPASHNYWDRVPQLLKPTHLEPVLCNKRSHRNEEPALAATRESPHPAMKTQCSQNLINFFKKLYMCRESIGRCSHFLYFLHINFFNVLVFSFKILSFLNVSVHLQLLPNIAFISPYCKIHPEPVLHPTVYTSHCCTPILLLPPSPLGTTSLFSIYVSFLLCYIH